MPIMHQSRLPWDSVPTLTHNAAADMAQFASVHAGHWGFIGQESTALLHGALYRAT